MQQILSWNRFPRVEPARVEDLATRHDNLPELGLGERCIAYGNGRSYGQGDIFRRDGQLAASFVQDAMIRARTGRAGAL